MSRATQEATIEHSYSESEQEDLYARLLAVMKEEAELRTSLKTVLDREEEKLVEACRKAEENVALFRARREKISRETRRNRIPSLVSHQSFDLVNTYHHIAILSRT
jgi:hypothetical protein